MNVSRKRGRSRSARPVKRRVVSSPSSFAKVSRVPATLQLRRPEKKSVDTLRKALEFDTVGNFTLLNAIDSGSNEYQRVGRKISMRSVAIRGFVKFAQAGSTPSFDFLRLILFYDRQPNGAAPALADVLTSVDRAGTTESVSTSGLNINNADRFKVLRDWYWPIIWPATGTTPQNAELAAVPETIAFKDFIKLGGMETHYNAGTAGTIADITTGSLYLLAVGLQSNANHQWNCTFDCRVRYLDQ